MEENTDCFFFLNKKRKLTPKLLRPDRTDLQPGMEQWCCRPHELVSSHGTKSHTDVPPGYRAGQASWFIHGSTRHAGETLQMLMEQNGHHGGPSYATLEVGITTIRFLI